MMSSRILTGIWFLGLAVYAHPVLADTASGGLAPSALLLPSTVSPFPSVTELLLHRSSSDGLSSVPDEEPSSPERPLKRRNNSTVHLGFDLGASHLSGLQRVQDGGEEALPGGAGFSMTAMEVGILLRPNVHLLLQVGDALYDESAQGVYEEYWLDSTSMLFYDIGVAWFPWENRGLYGEALVGLGIVESGAITILGEEGEELRDTGMNLGLGLGQQWPLGRRLHLNLEVSGHHHQGAETRVNALLFQGGLHWYL